MGTQDTLLFDSDKTPENNIKLVSPSQTQIIKSKVSKSNNNLVISGETMGGGPISNAIIKHVKKGFKVVMTEDSARTINDDLKQVTKLGIKIIKENEVTDFTDFDHITTSDVNFDLLLRLLKEFNVLQKDIDFVGIAVQDHGYSEGKSDRTFRFERIKKILENEGKLKDFAYLDPPKYLTRMCSAIREGKRYFDNVLTVDTKIAAIAGSTHEIDDRPIISVDIGNGHTLGALIDTKDIGMFEHHTHSLTKKKLENMLTKLSDGVLSNKEVFDDGGHGCYVRKKAGMENISRILVTGPNRKLLDSSKLDVEFANPTGDVMMTGPTGIVDIIIENFI